MPAGTCPGCGKTYCVGCRKDVLDDSGRFVCPDCGKTLKLTDDGLKNLLSNWAKKNLRKKRTLKTAEPSVEPEQQSSPPESDHMDAGKSDPESETNLL